MMKSAFLIVVSISSSLWVANATAQAQTVVLGGPLNPSGSLGSRAGASSTRGMRARAVNPNFNPPGSPSTFQRLNPPGSNSPALNLNPRGSVFHPRNGTDDPSQPSTTVPSPKLDQEYKPTFVPTEAQLELMSRQSLCAWARSRTRQLEGELTRFKNGPNWIIVLQLEQITTILSLEQGQVFTKEDRQRLRATLKRFNKVATDTQYESVTQLPGFSPLHRALMHLLSVDASKA